jgi:hypothetical protein
MKKFFIYLFIVFALFVNSVSAVNMETSHGLHILHTNHLIRSNSVIIDPTSGNLTDAIKNYDEIILNPGNYTGEKNRNIIIPNNRDIYIHGMNSGDAIIQC